MDMGTKQKQVKKISGVDMLLEVGKPATVRMGHQWFLTSPVQQYRIAGGKAFIETQNTIYVSGRA